MAATLTATEVTSILNSIFSLRPGVATYGLRRQPRTEWAKAVRAYLKANKISGVKVTTPNCSQAHSIEIRLPRTEDICDHWTRGLGMYDCPNCAAEASKRHQACQHLEWVLNGTFPEMQDRSDALTDYYDFCWSIA